jgi:hypothetical protein
MMLRHARGRLQHLRPGDRIPLYRLMSGPSPDAHEFVSNAAMEKVRLFPYAKEDALTYKAISAHERFTQARRLAESVNGRLNRQEKPPRWSYIARFYVDGHLGHALAQTRTEGHFSVWGEPEALASTVDDVRPITSEGP